MFQQKSNSISDVTPLIYPAKLHQLDNPRENIRALFDHVSTNLKSQIKKMIKLRSKSVYLQEDGNHIIT